MNRVFPHSDRKGMDAALDLVEATIASLQKRVEKEDKQKAKESRKEKRVKDAATNTTPPPSITSSKASKKPRKAKSVLIKRNTHFRAKRPTNLSHSSAQRRFGKHIFEIVAEDVPQAHCTLCDRRPVRAEGQDRDASQERRKQGATRPSYDDSENPETQRVKWKRRQRCRSCGEVAEDDQEGTAAGEVRQRYRRRKELKEGSGSELPVVREKIKQRHRSHRRREESEEESDLDSSSSREKVVWRHRKRGHGRKKEPDDGLDSLQARERVIWRHNRGHSRRQPDNDPEPPPAREEVIWRGCNRREETESDLDSQSAREKVTWRGLNRREESESSLDSTSTREVILQHKRGHSRREGPEDCSKSCSCHRNSHTTRRQAKVLSDPEVREKVTWRHGKRGHSRQEGSDDTSEDSSCHKPIHKSRRPRTLSSRPRQTVEESLHTRPNEDFCSRPRCNRQEDVGSDTGRSRGKRERKEAVDVDKQGYAQPTITSRLRVDQTRPKKKEKENILPYVPCGAKSHSYHVGVISQQGIGCLLSQPLQEHNHTHSRTRGSGQPGCVAGVTEAMVRQAMTNINQHLKGRSAHSDPGL